jgi:metal-responsive CopG/Arc/MetJ family transcriptional regulator
MVAPGRSYETGTRKRVSLPDKPSRSEAIRRLIEIALTAKSKRQSARGEKQMTATARITKTNPI